MYKQYLLRIVTVARKHQFILSISSYKRIVHQHQYSHPVTSMQTQSTLSFMQNHQNSLSPSVRSADKQSIVATVLPMSDVSEAAEMISKGELVAFPTETVYGLGANALNEKALRRIYEVKSRPLTDPIIVHVLDQQKAQELVLLTPPTLQLFQILTQKFWPGPLTVILKANLQVLPKVVTANTGFVGIRSPKDPYARALLKSSSKPIGAPSANLFGHVSPTEAVHVFNDFYDQKVYIVDGPRCQYGVESTVVKLTDENELIVFREGSLSVQKLSQFLQSELTAEQQPKLTVLARTESKEKNMQAPGQLLKHYAPYLPCFYIQELQSQNGVVRQQGDSFLLSDMAMISFSQKFSEYGSKCKFYFQVGRNMEQDLPKEIKNEEIDIFCSEEDKLKMREIYYLLRKCENLEVKAILVGWNNPKTGTMWDKIYRCTQGKQAYQEK